MQTAIIADDLTGACDAAARAAMAGWRPRVVLRGNACGELVAVSTASRGFTEVHAAQVVARAACRLIACGFHPAFKKIDSTLRGPWAHEVAALREVLGADIVAVCPAFPACGRVVRGGNVYCHGELIGALAPPLAAAGIADALIADAATEQDLAAFARSVAAMGRSVLWVGSAGLAQFAFPNPSPVERPPLPVAATWLVVSDSQHPATQAQVKIARDAGIPVSTSVPKELPERSGLFLIGGDTAQAAVRALGVTAMDVFGEVLPGIVAGRLAGGRAGGTPFLTKSGGFGEPEDVVRAIRLCCGSAESA